MTLRDFIRWDSIALQKKKIEERGRYEVEALKRTGNVMGRTSFDYAAMKSINNAINYYYCPENLRKEFCECSRKWNLNTCQKHSIFMSQGSYPIKGVHIALRALSDVKKRYPDVKLYIAGDDIYNSGGVITKLKAGSYAKYIRELVDNYGLRDNISFVGRLGAKEMVDYYLMSNVFILPSIIENSPNSLLEAMSLGVPVISSNVGGVSDFVNHKINGFMYPVDEYFMLSYYIMEVFENTENSMRISDNAFDSVRKRIDVNKNIGILISVYNRMMETI